MKDVLLDLIKQTSPLLDVVLIKGTPEKTEIAGCDGDKTLFVQAELKHPIQEFEGEFGLTNMNLLNGLLNFSNFRTDDATFSVKKKEHAGKATVEEFNFRNKATGNSSDFRLMSPDLVPQQATISNIPWDVTITPNKAKVTEFQQLAGLYAEVDKLFGIRTTAGGDLEFFIGDVDSSSHRVSMVFEAGVTGTLKGDLQWNTQQFLSVMKLTGSASAQLSITSRGVLSISVDTAHGTYAYFLRANR